MLVTEALQRLDSSGVVEVATCSTNHAHWSVVLLRSSTVGGQGIWAGVCSHWSGCAAKLRSPISAEK